MFLSFPSASEAEVILGAQNVNDPTEASQITLTSTDLTVHPNYGSILIRNDIAVLRLPEPVEYTGTVLVSAMFLY